jgi:hypothetical protein
VLTARGIRLVSTKAALLTYLRAEPRPLVQVVKFMSVMHHVKPGATRQALYVLCKAGLVERMAGRFYQIRG